MPTHPNSRTQLTLFPALPLRSKLDALRLSLDPVQASLIPAHVTLCREDEIENQDLTTILQRARSWPHGALTLSFGQAQRFNGHGILLPCLLGSSTFQDLRQWLLQGPAVREHHAHLTLAHPRNPRSSGNNEASLAACPQSLELSFRSVSLIEQHGGLPWRVLQEASLGGTESSVA